MTASLAVSRHMLHSKVLSCPPLSPAPLLLPLGPPALEFSVDAEAEGPLLAMAACQQSFQRRFSRQSCRRRRASASDATSPSPSPTVGKPVLETRQSERLNLRPLLPGPWSPDTEPPLLEQLPVTAGKGWCAAPSSDPGKELVSSVPGREGEGFGPFRSVS